MRRAVFAIAIAVGMVTGFAWPSSAIGLTQVTLTCDDGTTSTMTVDAGTVVVVAQAVQAMIDYPAGLTCAIAPFGEDRAIELQRAWAKHLGRKVVEKIGLGNKVELELVLIPPGQFMQPETDARKETKRRR